MPATLAVPSYLPCEAQCARVRVTRGPAWLSGRGPFGSSVRGEADG